MENHELISLAKQKMKPKRVNSRIKVSDAVCVAISAKGNVYYAYSLRASCGLGGCAEQFLIAEMLKNDEYHISKLVVLDELGNLLPPCGRCCELITQLAPENKETQIVLSDTQSITLNKIFCLDWKDVKNATL